MAIYGTTTNSRVFFDINGLNNISDGSKKGLERRSCLAYTLYERILRTLCRCLFRERIAKINLTDAKTGKEKTVYVSTASWNRLLESWKKERSLTKTETTAVEKNKTIQKVIESVVEVQKKRNNQPSTPPVPTNSRKGFLPSKNPRQPLQTFPAEQSLSKSPASETDLIEEEEEETLETPTPTPPSSPTPRASVKKIALQFSGKKKTNPSKRTVTPTQKELGRVPGSVKKKAEKFKPSLSLEQRRGKELLLKSTEKELLLITQLPRFLSEEGIKSPGKNLKTKTKKRINNLLEQISIDLTEAPSEGKWKWVQKKVLKLQTSLQKMKTKLKKELE